MYSAVSMGGVRGIALTALMMAFGHVIGGEAGEVDGDVRGVRGAFEACGIRAEYCHPQVSWQFLKKANFCSGMSKRDFLNFATLLSTHYKLKLHENLAKDTL